MTDDNVIDSQVKLPTETNPIECQFRKIPYSCQEGFKDGLYSSTMYWNIEGYGVSKWMVLGYIEVDWVNQEQVIGRSRDKIIAGCLNYLNKVPERQKHQKKDPRPVYGNLSLYRAVFKTSRIDDGKHYIIAELISDEHNNENFWSEGTVTSGKTISNKKSTLKVEAND